MEMHAPSALAAGARETGASITTGHGASSRREQAARGDGPGGGDEGGAEHGGGNEVEGQLEGARWCVWLERWTDEEFVLGGWMDGWMRAGAWRGSVRGLWHDQTVLDQVGYVMGT